MSSTTTRAQRTRRARPFGGFGVLEYLAVIVVALFFLFPAYWMIKGSFESANALLRGHLFFTELPTLENYRFLFQQAAFRHYFINSMLTSVLTTVLSTTLAVATMLLSLYSMPCICSQAANGSARSCT